MNSFFQSKGESSSINKENTGLLSINPSIYGKDHKQSCPPDVSSKRTINCISLAFIAYFAVSAGPFGIEDAVRGAGAFPVIIAILILPLLWGMPQALMTVELSTMMNQNGGYILWVKRGLGEFGGWMNAFNSIASNILDLPTYPVLFAGYVKAYLTHQQIEVSNDYFWGLKFLALLFVVVANVVGMQSVAFTSIFISIFILAPFFLEPFFIQEMHIETWGQSASDINWSLFLSTLIWNYQGWDSLGCIAGEVKDVGVSYPRGVALALVIITVNYALPVLIGTAVQPDFSLWDEGMLETVALQISNSLGIWIGLGAIVSTLGEFNVVMACTSRALWATSMDNMLPQFLSWEWKRFNTPVAAILVQSVIVIFLMNFSFSELVIIDTFFNNFSLLLEFAAYIRLKYTEPDTYRPYEVPGGKLGGWIITLPKAIVISCVLFSSDSFTWILWGSFNLVFVLAYFIWKRFRDGDSDYLHPKSIATLNSPIVEFYSGVPSLVD